MKTGYPRLAGALLALLAGMAGALMGQSATAQGSVDLSPRGRSTSELVVPIAGTVQTEAERVVLTGKVRIASTLVTDPDFRGPTSVILAIELLDVRGVGQSTRSGYVATGQQRLTRLLARSDLIQTTFPVLRTGSGIAALARPALALFGLTFDLSNGQLRAATAGFSTLELSGTGSGP